MLFYVMLLIGIHYVLVLILIHHVLLLTWIQRLNDLLIPCVICLVFPIIQPDIGSMLLHTVPLTLRIMVLGLQAEVPTACGFKSQLWCNCLSGL